jgi:hypothetical protein
MGLRTYLITAAPGRPPAFYLLDEDGAARTPVAAASVPPQVSRHAAWLAAWVDGRPLPPGAPPPAVFGDPRRGEPVAVVVTVEE